MTLDSSSDSDAGAKWTTKISMRSFLSSPATAFLALPLPLSTRRPPPPPHARLYSPLPLSPHDDSSHFFSYLGRFLSTLQAFLEDVFPSHDAFPRSPASLPQEVAAPPPATKRRRRRQPRSDAAAAQGFAALKRNCGSGASTARRKRRRRGGEDQRAGGVSATLVASSSQLTVSD